MTKPTVTPLIISNRIIGFVHRPFDSLELTLIDDYILIIL